MLRCPRCERRRCGRLAVVFTLHAALAASAQGATAVGSAGAVAGSAGSAISDSAPKAVTGAYGTMHVDRFGAECFVESSRVNGCSRLGSIHPESAVAVWPKSNEAFAGTAGFKRSAGIVHRL